MLKFKCSHHPNTICVYAVMEGQKTHLANIDIRSNRIYTTHGAYELLADNRFKENHVLKFLDFDDLERDWCMSDLISNKFDAVIMFNPNELSQVISMCSREYVA